MDRRKQHIAIVGAGIGGLSAARALLARGARRVTILEEERTACSKASGLNAAIYRPLESDPLIAELSARSGELLGELQAKSEVPLIDRKGLLMLGPDVPVMTQMRQNAERYGIQVRALETNETAAYWPGLTVEPQQNVIFSPDGGVLDPHEIGQVMLRQLGASDILVRYSSKVSRLLFGGRAECVGLELASGEQLHADAVVLAGGAETGRLAFQAGVPLPLLPLQRHLAILEAEAAQVERAPVVWQLDPEIYFRVESGGILVSPCDETPKADARAQNSVSALFPLAERLHSIFPTLARAKLRRSWACIRTKAPDTRPVIGPLPSREGLFVLSALAGFGMSCGLACGELLAESILDGKTKDLVAPSRLYPPFLGG